MIMRRIVAARARVRDPSHVPQLTRLGARLTRSFSGVGMHPRPNKPIKNVLCLTKITQKEQIRRGLLKPLPADEKCQEADIEHGVTVNAVLAVLGALPVELRVIERIQQNDVEWADVVVSVGGDGTFLRAARRFAEGTHTIALGVNSSPSSSFGQSSAVQCSAPAVLCCSFVLPCAIF